MPCITNLVPIRIDASSSDGTVRIIDTLLIDTNCLPISHFHPPHDGNSFGLSPLSSGIDRRCTHFSLSSLIDANAKHLTETILADAEVYWSGRSSKTSTGDRLDLLGDITLCLKIEEQIRMQLGIALSAGKWALISSGGTLCGEVSPSADGAISSGDGARTTSPVSMGEESKVKSSSSNIVRIKLRLRHENIVVVDEFDYDISISGIEGSDPFSIATSLVEDLKLPPELGPSIAASIVEQIYGVDVSDSIEGLTSNPSIRKTPTALYLDTTRDGSSSDFARMMLNN